MNHRNTLLRVKQLFDTALPKFNWGASTLDADAIRLLNDVPAEVTRALMEVPAQRERHTLCIITGCSLQLEGGMDSVSGDLFIQGDRFIFNGNWQHGDACWINGVPYSKVITIPVGWDYFERRGMFVMKASRALLNAVANVYTANEDIPS